MRQHPCRSRAVRDGFARTSGPAAAPRHGAGSPQRLASAPPWPGSSPSMRARPACAPWPSTSGPGSPTSPTASSPSTSPARAGSSTTPPRSGRPSGPRWPRWAPGWPRPASRWRPSASPTSARPWSPSTARTGRPLHRAIVWQDRRTAAICAELTEAGHLPLVRARTGLVLDPYFSATKVAWLLRHGELALGAGRPRPLLLHGGQLGAVEPDRRDRRWHLRHRPLQRQPHPAARYGDPRLVARALRPLRRAPPHAARGAAVGRALRHGRARPTSGPPAPCSTACRSRACWATSRPRSSGRPASTPAWSR